MEKRAFGNTGLQSTILGFGGFHLIEIPLTEADWLLNTYLDAGGNYIETAASYNNGESERKIGRSVSHRRSDFMLVSKTDRRDAAGFTQSLDQSLVNLRTDHLDVMLMHGVATDAELDTILGPGGAIEAAEVAVRQGRIHHIGISMHGQPDTLIRALNEYPFRAVMSTINYYDRFNFPAIEDTLLPLALSKETAIILMKPVADGLLYQSAPQAFRFAFSQPVSVVVAGINNRQMLADDLQYAASFAPMSEPEKQVLYNSAPELGNYVCRQCLRCLPCPENVDIPRIFELEGWFDRQMANGTVGDSAEYGMKERLRFWFNNCEQAQNQYAQLSVKADACNGCAACKPRCTYGIDIIHKLKIADYKLANRDIF